MASLSKKEVRKASKGKNKAQSPKSILKKAPTAAVDDDEGMDEEWEDELSDEDESEDEDEENGGVSEEGMKRLMELVGEEDLDDYERARLGMNGEAEEDEDLSGDEEEEEEEDGEEEENQDADEVEGEAQEDEIALDEIDSDASVDEDAVPVRKVVTDNKPAMKILRDSIAVTSLPWPEHLTLLSKDKVTADPSDDLQREVNFYKIALEAVGPARKLCAKHDIPFSRPHDYYAEMVKSDEHMERVRTKLVEEATGIKKSEAAKKQRDLKKFGKQIQQEKLKQREMEKKSFSERMHGVKRKRKEGMDLGSDNDGDDFGIEVENVIEGRDRGRFVGGKGGKPGFQGSGKPKMPRQARDSKYSLGGGGRRAKQNTKESTNDFSGWNPNASRGKPGEKGGKAKKVVKNRPGKSRRKAGRA